MSASLGSLARGGLVLVCLAAACHSKPPVRPMPTDPTCRVNYTPLEARRRGLVVGRLLTVRRDITGCFERFHLSGYALTCIDVNGEGLVEHVSVEGALAGTDEAHCIEATVGAIKFPESSAPWSFDYPYVFGGENGGSKMPKIDPEHERFE
jgi:hypothetical protein